MNIAYIANEGDLYDFLWDVAKLEPAFDQIRSTAAGYFAKYGVDDWFDWFDWNDRAVDDGAVGVLTCDDEARLYRFLGHSQRMLGWFEPLHQPGGRIEHPLRDFWALVDSI